jgi:multidrug efflux pump subunit AcrA (membrane-fusion protein)
MRFFAVTKAVVLTATLAIGVSLTVSQCARALEAPPTSTGGAVVRVVHAVKECFSDSIFVTGFLVPRQEALVSVNEGSRVTEVTAKEGDQVKVGQVLARATRQEGPSAGPAAAPSRSTNTDILLKAPAAGFVIQSTARVGAVPSPRGEPMFRIMIDNEIEVEAEVPSIHVPKLKAGQAARVKVEYGAELNGRVRRVPAEIDRITQLGRARLSVAQDPSLRVGVFVRATIDASQSCGVAAPRDAIFVNTDGTSVQVVRDRKVETRRVRLGLSSETKFEIRDGLKEGEVVVANAGTSLHDGDQVQTIFVDESDN